MDFIAAGDTEHCDIHIGKKCQDKVEIKTTILPGKLLFLRMASRQYQATNSPMIRGKRRPIIPNEEGVMPVNDLTINAGTDIPSAREMK